MNRTLLLLTAVLALHLFSCSKESPVALKTAIGPSPSAFRNGFVSVGRVTYGFRDTATDQSKFFGLISLQDANGATLLLLERYCYAQILEDGTMLLWREVGEKDTRRIVFDNFFLTDLRPITDPLAIAAQMRQEKMAISQLAKSEHWEISSYMKAGVHPISIPYNWSRFYETLVLTDHEDFSIRNRKALAIFAFSWTQSQVAVFPQDWFNTGNYDFGYQGNAHVVRRNDGTIIGEGIRLGSFELDESNRRVKKWLSQDPFMGN